MKKTTLLAVILVLVLVLPACSTKNPVPKTASAESSVVEKEESEVAYKTVYGKVGGIAGNELALKLAKDPYADLHPAPEGDGDGGAAVAMAPATEAGAEAGSAPKMELEYTGEAGNYVIPAGVMITGKNGVAAQLDAISKGSVLLLLMEGDTVMQINILE